MKTSKAIVVMLMAMSFVFAMFPAGAMAAADDPVIAVDESYAKAGATVNVNVTIENNPGIIGGILEFTYAPELTLVEVNVGDALSALTITKPGKYDSPAKFLIDGESIEEEDIKDGVVLTLTFTVAENAVLGSMPAIKVVCEDMINNDLDLLDFKTQDGFVEILNYTPGDLNDDGKINPTDTIMTRRHIVGGFDQTIIEAAADVNDDNKVNATDVVLIRRYIATGYGIVLLPHHDRCAHEKIFVEAVPATCTEPGNIAYWHCEECDTYFKDANASVVLSAEDLVEPVISHNYVDCVCSYCGDVDPNAYKIEYHIDNNDSYLQSIEIDNSQNPAYYVSEKGSRTLAHLVVPGYEFVGWFTAQTGGDRVTKINVGETGNKALYAQWKKVSYNIYLKCDMDYQDKVPEAIPYSVGEDRPLPVPQLDKYTFVGWSDNSGKIWDSIPAGTVGDITLYANWVSDRNKAVAKEVLEDPIICEDPQNGLIWFTYEIGEIQKVPMYTLFNLHCANGIISSTERLETEQITTGQANTIADTIQTATTNSAAWTLSKEWTETTEVVRTKEQQEQYTQEEAETLAKSSSNTYNLSNSFGGKSGSIQTQNGSFNYSENQAHLNQKTTEVGANFGLSVDRKASVGVSAEAKVPVPGAVLGVGANAGFEMGVGTDFGIYGKQNNFEENKWSTNLDISKSYSNTLTDEKTWNTTASLSSSNSLSQTNFVSTTLSNLISEKYQYGTSYAEGRGTVETNGLEQSDSKSKTYSNYVTYDATKITNTRTEFTSTGNTYGNYRLVMANTVHVFAVVGYDMINKSYFTFTYSVVDDNEKAEEYLDYSYDGTFNDYETGIIPFEIPYFVNEYVNAKIAQTEGLKFEELVEEDGLTGVYVNYTDIPYEVSDPENPDQKMTVHSNIVSVPTYKVVESNDSGLNKTVKVTKISEGLFKNNTDITAVLLGAYITEIPESAFEGCTNLQSVIAPGVTKIGKNAFKGCGSLETFEVSEAVTFIGETAFDGVPSIKVNASSKSVALAAASSGAKNVTLDLSYIPEDNASGIELNVGEIESFALWGKNKVYKDLSLKSDADSTSVVGVTFTENTKYPMEISSVDVLLERVNVDCTGFALVLKADTTNLKVNHTVNLSSDCDSVVLGKNVVLSEYDSEHYVGKIVANGDVLCCGSFTGQDYISFEYGSIQDQDYNVEDFNAFFESHVITFNANGGTFDENEKSMNFMPNTKIGKLPEPQLAGYAFVGWFTELDGGKRINSNSCISAIKDFDVYAKWEKSAAQINFNANGGTSSVGSMFVAMNSVVGDLPVATKSGYKFCGWFTDPVGGEEITEETIFTSLDTITVYAHWVHSWAETPVVTVEYSGHIYELYDNHMGWTEAKEFCEDRGGHLVTITSAEENYWMSILVKKGSCNTYYIGASDEEVEGTWKWVTGEAFSYANWDSAVPEPSNVKGQNYGQIIAVNYPPNKEIGEWNDTYDKYSHAYYGYEKAGFILERELTQSVSFDLQGGIVDPGSEDENLVNNKVVNSTCTGTYSYLPLPKKDGFVFEGWFTAKEGGRKISQNSPYVTDTLYAQWIEPGNEVPTATMEYNGHTYEMYDYHMTWSEAKTFCEKRGGTLVAITTKAENAAVTRFIDGGYSGVYYIGFVDEKKNGTWKWVTGETSNYTNWDQHYKEPDVGYYKALIMSQYYHPNKHLGEWVGAEDSTTHRFYGYMNAGFILEKDYIENVSD